MCRDNNMPLRIFSMAENDALVLAMTDLNVGTLVTA
jgi:uridylate kinase